MNPTQLEYALLNREIQVRGEKTVIPLNLQASCECRDSLAKHLYGSLFEYLVKRINVALATELDPRQTKVIGVLDIFGFEIFDVRRVFEGDQFIR